MSDNGWDPDAVAPPGEDVYERESKAAIELRAWGLVAFCAAMVAWAIWELL